MLRWKNLAGRNPGAVRMVLRDRAIAHEALRELRRRPPGFSCRSLLSSGARSARVTFGGAMGVRALLPIERRCEQVALFTLTHLTDAHVPPYQAVRQSKAPQLPPTPFTVIRKTPHDPHTYPTSNPQP
jgi:hypothetical protein